MKVTTGFIVDWPIGRLTMVRGRPKIVPRIRPGAGLDSRPANGPDPTPGPGPAGGGWRGVGLAGFHYDEKYGANRYADEEEEEDGANLLGGLGGGGHAQPGQVQAVNHQVDAEGDQRSGHDPGNPVEEGEGRKGQIQQLVRQEHQANQRGG